MGTSESPSQANFLLRLVKQSQSFCCTAVSTAVNACAALHARACRRRHDNIRPVTAVKRLCHFGQTINPLQMVMDQSQGQAMTEALSDNMQHVCQTSVCIYRVSR